jgi:BNR/Asp-box repeat
MLQPGYKDAKSLSISGNYSLFIEKRKKIYLFEKIPRFLLDVYRDGKAIELISFIIWEILHKAKLFRKYISFHNLQPLSLVAAELNVTEHRPFFMNLDLKLNLTDLAWRVLFIDHANQMWGCTSENPKNLYAGKVNSNDVKFIYKFDDEIISIFVSSQNTIFVCISGFVYRSTDQGKSFQLSLEFSNQLSFFVFNQGMTETNDHRLFIGEYGNIKPQDKWVSVAYLYYSLDEGMTWEKSDFLIKNGVNKHIHIVQYSWILNQLIVTDGDNKKQYWLIDLPQLDQPQLGHHSWQWKLVNQSHLQTGGYTSIIEANGKLIFGTDYNGGTNFIITTIDGKKLDKQVIPDPYRRSPVFNLVGRKSRSGVEIWATIHSSMDANAKSLLMYTTDNGQSWTKVIEYDGTRYQLKIIDSSQQLQDILYFSITDSLVSEYSTTVYQITDAYFE